jgi:hypothetical protein
MSERERIEQEIRDLTCDLTASDYKVTKYMECTAAGLEPPYDIQAVHAERQAKRDRINELQAILDQLEDEEVEDNG